MRMKLKLKKIKEPENNLSGAIWEEAFKLLKETAKKVTTVGTKPLLFGMAAVTMLSSGIEDNNQNIEELKRVRVPISTGGNVLLSELADLEIKKLLSIKFSSQPASKIGL